MNIIRSNKLVFIDVDGTLCMWMEDKEKYGISDADWVAKSIEVGIDDFTTKVYPNQANIDFIYNLKAQGNTLIVWSHGGYEWAEAVVKELGIESWIDTVMSKPCLCVDDLPSTKWMPRRLWKAPK